MEILLYFLAGGAFVILGVMIALLRVSSLRDERDPVTQEIIVRANSGTGPIIVNAPVQPSTQEEDR